MKALFFCFGTVVLVLACTAGGIKRISGTIHVTGNEPHTELIIKTNEGKVYVINGDKAGYLRKEKQNNLVQINGRIISEPKDFVKGTIEVIDVE
jgi:hypothetical protein